MKNIIIILFLFISSASYAQNMVPVNSKSYAEKEINRLRRVVLTGVTDEQTKKTR